MDAKGKSRLSVWLYRGSLAVLVLLFVGFSVVMPIDAMAQASRSTNDALNTFIVVGAFVAFGVLSIIIAAGRVFVQRSCLQDIPKRYLPLTPEDLPHRGSRELVLRQMDRSYELAQIFKRPTEAVVHDGLSRPIDESDKNDHPILPPLLNYEDSIKIITSRLKYQGVFCGLMELGPPIRYTFADVIHTLFTQTGQHSLEAAEYIEIYEHIRFSGQEITSIQFLRFMDLSLFLVNVLLRIHQHEQPESELLTPQPNDFDSSSEIDLLNVRDRTSETHYLTTTNTNSTVARRVTAKNSEQELRRLHDALPSEAESYESVVRGRGVSI
ncbi:LAME_0F17964g1_1 [Lachancea meyersii CBS 8951]|uniref:Defect at low temperature protein 1 n=1 Tax=Lachancea meyersii CBS 8951 TaxID=1266667 RepID=A0A1G4K095_9SACH|nr:LAME_0F17964g1_1 [Lachancea meyersii CBS 8951]